MGLPPGETGPGSSGSLAAAGAPGANLAVGAPHSTGDARVDEAVARLNDLAGLPVAEHVAIFEYVHERLMEALGDLDVPDSAGADDDLSGPGTPDG